MNEIFKNIAGYDGIYQISNFGRVFSYKNGKWGRNKFGKEMKPTFTGGKTQYACVNLYKNNKPKMFFVHILVASYFLENPNDYTCANHLDGDKANNHYTNLKWCTKSEDVQHAWDTGLKPRKYKKR